MLRCFLAELLLLLLRRVPYRTCNLLVLVRRYASEDKLLMPISLPELVQTVLKLVNRRSIHDLLW